MFFHDRGTDPAGDLHLFAVIVKAIRYDRLATVLIGDNLLWWKSCRIIKFLVISPVGTTAMYGSLESDSESKRPRCKLTWQA
jgi:hypothetical protein